MTIPIPEPFKWDASFDIAQDTLNAQHVKFFELIDALDKNRDSAEVLQQLLDLVVVHFKTEEDLFEQNNFAEKVEHKATHDKFVQDALAVKVINDDVIQFLKSWLVTHIKVSDIKYKGKL